MVVCRSAKSEVRVQFPSWPLLILNFIINIRAQYNGSMHGLGPCNVGSSPTALILYIYLF